MKQILILQRTVAHVLVPGKQRECLAKVIRGKDLFIMVDVMQLQPDYTL